MIEGVIVKELNVHEDERGKLFEILRNDDELFSNFGQAYITVCKEGFVKGWHYHETQTDNFCVVKGKARIVLWDRNTKEVNDFVLSDDEPKVLVIPKGVVHGFECLSDGECRILNIPDKKYNRENPDEQRIPLDSPEAPYEEWKTRKGW